MNHYDTLGVPRDATAADIRAAYKRQAKAQHPDRAQGDSQRMQALNVAYHTLKDARRREHYDATGEDTVTDIVAEAEKFLLQGIDAAFEQLPLDSDIPLHMSHSIRKLREENKRAAAKLHANITKWEAQLKQLRRKKDTGRANLFELIGEQKISGARQAVAAHEARNEMLAIALDMLSNYEAVGLAPAAPNPFQGISRRSWYGSFWCGSFDTSSV